MRDRLALCAAVSTMVLALAVSPSAWSQQEVGGAAREKAGNQAGAQDRTQRPSEMETIRGVVAGVTAEGETIFDHRSNRAVWRRPRF